MATYAATMQDPSLRTNLNTVDMLHELSRYGTVIQSDIPKNEKCAYKIPCTLPTFPIKSLRMIIILLYS
ncbi:hypothetical protein EYC80_007793 [Monilinia laxa]|uniref:Uncharacterized protein n=1 Tax=Monilinia laxa TaxID=61186 RepID=A0A5N6JX01_MONLA|nr:hypothetical protein EYC80_007793 [Monilinia laxa]